MGESIAVVGPGRMGVGIVTAILLANQGHAVTLFDTKERKPGQEMIALEKARCEIRDNMLLLSELGLWAGDSEQACAGIGVRRNLSEICHASFIFEALPEKVELKKNFFAAVGGLIGEEAVIASATSTFHLSVFLDVCAKPGNMVTAHWLNPAFLIPLVEIAHGEKTHPWAVERTQIFLRSIGKIPVTMKSSPGFIVPRIQVAAMNEALRILEEGVTTAEEIDTAIKAGFGFRLGVLGLMEFIDLGGVDILSHAGNYLHSALGGNHYKPPELVSEKIRLNEVGPRTGKGIFDYTNVDTATMFQEKYRGFVELLNLYKKSSVLSFAGGIEEKSGRSLLPQLSHKSKGGTMRFKHKFRFVVFFVALCISLGGVGVLPAAAGDKITLTYAFFAPMMSFPGAQINHWVEELEKRTDGMVEVKVFGGGTLLGARNMFDGVMSGVADIGLSCPSYDPGRFPLTSGVSLPVNFPSSKVASLTYWDLMAELKPAEYAKFKVITMFTTEPGYIQSKIAEIGASGKGDRP